MKTSGCAVVLVLAVLVAPTPCAAQCTAIQSGLLLYQPTHYLVGQPITTGVNIYGYNYQAHAFSGSFFNAYAGGIGLPPWDGDDGAYLAAHPEVAGHWAWPFRRQDLAMKWNDEWLSNKDCNGDGLLDRPSDNEGTYVGSGAWLTNHLSYSTALPNGRLVHAYEFVKVVALPEGATIAEPKNAIFGQLTAYLGERVIGPQIWNEMAVIEYAQYDPSAENKRVALRSQIASGLGFYKGY